MPLRLAPRLVVCLAAVAGCTQFPQIIEAETPGLSQRAYPEILPLDGLLAGPAPRATAETRSAVQSRVAALEARAARLRGPVIDAATRDRLDRGVDRAG